MKLGQTLRCKVTGFTGVATAKIEYLNGCTQFCLKRKWTEGKMPEGEWVDIEQLEAVDENVVDVTPSPTGGSYDDAPNI